jgi:hypothetical protein
MKGMDSLRHSAAFESNLLETPVEPFLFSG